jgi:hypothetical protein
MIGFLRPYLAIIKDSFREALATWVLKIMLILITIFLLMVAPVAIRRELTWHLLPLEILDVEQLAARLVLDAAQDKPSPAKHIWGLIDSERQEQIKSAASGRASIYDLEQLYFGLAKELNEHLPNEEFYDRQSWGVSIDKLYPHLRGELGRPREEDPQPAEETESPREEGEQSLDEDERLLVKDVDRLSTNELARRNRLLLEAAFPDLIEVSGPTSFKIGYLWFDFPIPVPITPELLELILNYAVTIFMDWLAGPIGVLAGILLTAAIIPRTLETGSIELLLSKPVSRTLLFLSKFFGGCAFMFVNAVYLIGGLWLILGFRFGVWSHGLLLCIPVYVFLFAVYYSVSALAGLIWRNAILSVVVTIIFWVSCWGLWFLKDFIEGRELAPNRIVRIVDADHALVTVSETGQAKRWDRDTQNWQNIFQPAATRTADATSRHTDTQLKFGPLYDARNHRLIAIGETALRRGGFVIGTSLWIATPERLFKRIEGAPVPPGTSELLFEPDGGLITVSTSGVYRLVSDAEKKPESVTVLGLPIPQRAPFERVGPEPPVAVLPPSTVAMNPVNGELAIRTGRRLLLLSRGADGLYRARVEKGLGDDTQSKQRDDDKQSAVMAYAGTTILLAREDGLLRVIRSKDLQVIETLKPEGANAARFIHAAPNGTWFALVYHNGRLHLYDAKERKVARRRFAGQGDISAAAFTDNRTLLVADRTTRVTSYDVVANKRLKRWSPKMDFYERSYRYFIVPVYTIYPKPGELGRTVLYLLSEQETLAVVGSDMREAREQLKPWVPVWSSALFMAVILAISCLYLWRTDL